MPQNPITPRAGGNSSKLNITAATVVKATPGTVFTVTVNAVATAGSFGIYDAKTTASAAASNTIIAFASAWPAVGTVFEFQWPCSVGIVVNPGTGGNVSIAYS